MWFPWQHQKWIVSFGHWNVCIKLDRFKFWLSRCELLQFLWQKLGRKKVGWIYSLFNRSLQKLGKTVSIITTYTFLFSVLNLQWSPLMKMRFDHIAHNSNLYNNQLSGGIPSTLGQLQHLKYLYVKAWILCSLDINDGMHRLFLFLNNGYNGFVQNIRYLSSNSLTGSIPPSLTMLRNLTVLYVCHGCFEFSLGLYISSVLNFIKLC
jgi:hypothetical protein